MNIELRASDEFRRTLITSMVPDVQVSVAVLLKCSTMAEFSWTEFASEWLFFRVSSHMGLKFARLRELARTHSASEWLLSRVSAHMSQESTASDEFRRTLITSMVSDVQVTIAVLFQ